MTAPTRVALVACSAAKLTHPAPARDLYTSTLFRKASTYAEASCARWYILSAKHGLVHPNTVLAPYDVTLSAKPTAWADQVHAQLATELAGTTNVLLVALAGVRYRTALHPAPWPHDAPMRGLGIGQQLAWLTQQNATHTAQLTATGR